VEDKSGLKRFSARLKRMLRWLSAYPSLLMDYLVAPDHDVVIVPYMGHLDVLLLAPLARLRKKPLVWDAFLSLYDTVVNDRGLLPSRSAAARMLLLGEKLACRAADLVFLDTRAHARFFEETFDLPPSSVGRVFVGAEDLFFKKGADEVKGRECDFQVLFYGQFIPLHGVETIVRAASLAEQSSQEVRWTLIGSGQEADRVDGLIEQLGVGSITRVPWVPYDQLPCWIRGSDVGLGIFGTSGKAARVIPNKVYQILACGTPLITADTPAIRELLKPSPSIRLVPPGDSEALAEAVLDMGERARYGGIPREGHPKGQLIGKTEVGNQLKRMLQGRFDGFGADVGRDSDPNGRPAWRRAWDPTDRRPEEEAVRLPVKTRDNG
jgi:glycosyltransferase involved in cell wall biosynthesis